MGYHAYPAVSWGEDSSDYKELINGEEVALNTARVSKIPYNRRWPGHQRSLEQTELNNFLAFEFSGEVELTVIPKLAFDTVRVFPQELEKDTVIDENGVVRIKLTEPKYFTVEPYGVHHPLHIFADAPADYKADGEVIYFGKGIHDAGVICLKSNQTLFIDEGALVYASVFALNAENVKIIGRGILDNSKNMEQILFECNAENNRADCGNAKRDYGVRFWNCKNVVVDGVTITHSLAYNIDFASCEGVLVKNVKLIGNWRYNTDGIHIANSVNVEVADCFLRCYDDSVCVRGYEDHEKVAMEKFGGGLQITKNIRVHGCVIWNDWGKGLFIGAATQVDEISSVVFENCKIIHPIHTPMDFLVVDYAYCHDIRFCNISVEYDDNPRPPKLQPNDVTPYKYTPKEYDHYLVSMYIVHHYEYSHDNAKNAGLRGKIENIRFENISVYSKRAPRFRYQGYSDEYAIKNISFGEILWNGEPLGKETFSKYTEIGQFVKGIEY